MTNPKIIKEWLDKARDDFLYASASLEDELSFYSQICFHFQQAAEKFLKAYIVAEVKAGDIVIADLDFMIGQDGNAYADALANRGIDSLRHSLA